MFGNVYVIIYLFNATLVCVSDPGRYSYRMSITSQDLGFN